MLSSNVYPPDETAAFVEEQAALEVLRKAREDFDAVKTATEEARIAFQEAEKDLDKAYQVMSELRPDQLRIWNEFDSYRAKMLSEISKLREQIKDMEIERRQLEQERNQKSTKNNRAIRANLAALEKKSSEIGIMMSKCYDELQREHDAMKHKCDFVEMQDYREKKNVYCMRKLEYELASQHLKTLEAALRSAEEAYAQKTSVYPRKTTHSSHS